VLLQSKSIKYFVGVAFAFALFIFTSFVTGTLGGWFDVLRVNRAYAEQVSLGPFRGVPRALSELAQSDSAVLFVAGLLTLTVLAISNPRLLHKMIHLPANQIVLSAAAGLFMSISLQGSSGYQNSPLVAMIIVLLCVNTALVLREYGPTEGHHSKLSRRVVLSTLVLSVVFLVPSNLNASITNPIGLAQRASHSWNQARDLPPVDQYLNNLSEGSTVALFISSNSRMYFTAANNLELVCRFHFLYPVDVKLFRIEHTNCLKASPDFVVWEDSRIYGEWLGFAQFWDTQREIVSSRYTLCRKFDSIEIYARARQKCIVSGTQGQRGSDS
jgi:hypothetical protein